MDVTERVAVGRLDRARSRRGRHRVGGAAADPQGDLAGARRRSRRGAGRRSRRRWRRSGRAPPGGPASRPGRLGHLDDGPVAAVVGAEPAGVDRAAERVADLGRLPGPAAGRGDGLERAFAAVGERGEHDGVVGRARRQPSASARATSTEVSEPLKESGAMRIGVGRGAARPPLIGGPSRSRSSRTACRRGAARGSASTPSSVQPSRPIQALGVAAGCRVEDEQPAAVGAARAPPRRSSARGRCRAGGPTRWTRTLPISARCGELGLRERIRSVEPTTRSSGVARDERRGRPVGDVRRGGRATRRRSRRWSTPARKLTPAPPSTASTTSAARPGMAAS